MSKRISYWMWQGALSFFAPKQAVHPSYMSLDTEVERSFLYGRDLARALTISIVGLSVGYVLGYLWR